MKVIRFISELRMGFVKISRWNINGLYSSVH